jgi:hypothetical protein
MEENTACRSTGEHLSEPPRRTSFPQHIPTTTDWCDVGQVTIDMLPDIALLEIFDFYVAQASDFPVQNRETWITLVHVCRNWRDIVFSSPRRLNLRLLVTPRRSVRTMLDTWPPLLIDIGALESKVGAAMLSFRPSSTTIAYVKSNSSTLQVLKWNKPWQPCRSHFQR